MISVALVSRESSPRLSLITLLQGERQMRRVIGSCSVRTLLVFVVALIVFLIPQPCAPAVSGSHFYICFPPNLVEGILLALVAGVLATLVGIVAFLYSLVGRRYRHALLIGIGVVIAAHGSFLTTMQILALIRSSVFNLNQITSLTATLALLTIISAPLLAVTTLLCRGTPPHATTHQAK
jgi:hypothetical protein